jgi:hypothetical protein
MAWYSGDSYQASAAALVANLSTTVTCPTEVDTPCPDGDLPVGGGYYILGSSTPPADVRIVMNTPYQSVNWHAVPKRSPGHRSLVYRAMGHYLLLRPAGRCHRASNSFRLNRGAVSGDARKTKTGERTEDVSGPSGQARCLWCAGLNRMRSTMGMVSSSRAVRR